MTNFEIAAIGINVASLTGNSVLESKTVFNVDRVRQTIGRCSQKGRRCY